MKDADIQNVQQLVFPTLWVCLLYTAEERLGIRTSHWFKAVRKMLKEGNACILTPQKFNKDIIHRVHQ